MHVQIQGHEARQGKTAFAFMVLRFTRPVDRDALLAAIRYVAPMVPDAEAFIGELPTALDEATRILGMPWTPPEAGRDVGEQRRLIESAASMGVEAAWFFQTGTSLPTSDDDDDDDDDHDHDDVDAEEDEDDDDDADDDDGQDCDDDSVTSVWSA